MPGICHFKREWIKRPEFRDWLEEGDIKTEAKCRLCKASFKLGAMGIGAVKSHMAGSKHDSLVKEKSKQIPLTFFPSTNST